MWRRRRSQVANFPPHEKFELDPLLPPESKTSKKKTILTFRSKKRNAEAKTNPKQTSKVEQLRLLKNKHKVVKPLKELNKDFEVLAIPLNCGILLRHPGVVANWNEITSKCKNLYNLTKVPNELTNKFKFHDYKWLTEWRGGYMTPKNKQQNKNSEEYIHTQSVKITYTPSGKSVVNYKRGGLYMERQNLHLKNNGNKDNNDKKKQHRKMKLEPPFRRDLLNKLLAVGKWKDMEGHEDLIDGVLLHEILQKKDIIIHRHRVALWYVINIFSKGGILDLFKRAFTKRKELMEGVLGLLKKENHKLSNEKLQLFPYCPNDLRKTVVEFLTNCKRIFSYAKEFIQQKDTLGSHINKLLEMIIRRESDVDILLNTKDARLAFLHESDKQDEFSPHKTKLGKYLEFEATGTMFPHPYELSTDGHKSKDFLCLPIPNVTNKKKLQAMYPFKESSVKNQSENVTNMLSFEAQNVSNTQSFVNAVRKELRHMCETKSKFDLPLLQRAFATKKKNAYIDSMRGDHTFNLDNNNNNNNLVSELKLIHDKITQKEDLIIQSQALQKFFDTPRFFSNGIQEKKGTLEYPHLYYLWAIQSKDNNGNNKRNSATTKSAFELLRVLLRLCFSCDPVGIFKGNLRSYHGDLITISRLIPGTIFADFPMRKFYEFCYVQQAVNKKFSDILRQKNQNGTRKIDKLYKYMSTSVEALKIRGKLGTAKITYALVPQTISSVTSM